MQTIDSNRRRPAHRFRVLMPFRPPGPDATLCVKVRATVSGNPPGHSSDGCFFPRTTCSTHDVRATPAGEWYGTHSYMLAGDLTAASPICPPSVMPGVRVSDSASTPALADVNGALRVCELGRSLQPANGRSMRRSTGWRRRFSHRTFLQPSPRRPR